MEGKENCKERVSEKWKELGEEIPIQAQIGGCVFGQKAISKISWDVNSTIPLALDTYVRKQYYRTEQNR